MEFEGKGKIMRLAIWIYLYTYLHKTILCTRVHVAGVHHHQKLEKFRVAFNETISKFI